MDIKLKEDGNKGILLISGQLDTNTAPEAQTLFMEMTERFDELVIDMDGLSYCSSAGLRTIMIVDQAMRGKGGNLVLRNVKPAVMEVFELVGFAGVLNFE